MPQPAKNFTNIPDDKIDADSPITQELMTWIRDNAEHLREWLGKDFAPAQNHNHDGVNSAHLTVAGSMIWFNEPILKVDITTNPPVTWTDLSVASDTGNDTAKVAILIVEPLGTNTCWMRKKGTPGPHAFVHDKRHQIFCPVDDNEILQYRCTSDIYGIRIALLGYMR